MKLIKRNDKYLIQRGIFFKEYLDMTVEGNYFGWYGVDYLDKYCSADSEIIALNQLRRYRLSIEKNKTKTVKWFV